MISLGCNVDEELKTGVSISTHAVLMLVEVTLLPVREESPEVPR